MNYTFSGFSKAGNAVVRGAIAAAQDMGHTYVGTEHLLLALARDCLLYTSDAADE